MALKDTLAKARNWWANRNNQSELYAAVNDQGLIRDDVAAAQTAPADERPSEPVKPEAIVKKATGGSIERKQNIEMLNEAFNKLVNQLQGINEHLGKQVTQNEDLMKRIDQMPELLESLPNAVENQKQVVEGLTEQFKARALKDRQFVESIDKIPVETARQTNALIDMGHKISVVADIDAQMSENFNKFNDTLAKLDADTVSQTDGIMQMSKTFAASDRYLKYIVSRQNKRFMWIFMTALGVCVFAILALVIGIVMVLNK